MSLERKNIRNKVVFLLKGKTNAVDNVYPARAIPNWHEDLPAIMVYPTSEVSEKFSVAPWDNRRTINLAIEIIATDPDELKLADQLDDLAEQVENALGVDDSLGGLVEINALTSTDFEYESTGEQPLGSCTMVYQVVYLKAAVANRNDQADFGEFKKVHADWQIKPLDDAEVEAVDDIQIR